MKNKLKYLIVTIILFISSLLLLNTTSYAGEQKLNSITYDAELNSDGSMNVTEKWDIRVSDTNTLFKTFDLDSSRYGRITDVKVKEISNSGVESNFIQTYQYAYHVEKGYYYALQTDNHTFEIAWGVSINSTAHKKYEISYKVTDAIKTYNDCSEFYWQFIGNTNGIPADKVTGTVRLPNRLTNKENIKVWAHGPLNGEINVVDNQTVAFKVNYLPESTMVEVRVATLENVFALNQNTINIEKLDEIIQEETEWAERANRERDRLKKQKEIITIIIIGLILIGLAIDIFFINKIIKYIKEIKKTKKMKPEQEIEYFREFPDTDATAGEAAFLYYFDKKTAFKDNLSKILSATMLNLGLKKAIAFVKDQKDKINISLNKNIGEIGLKSDESTIYTLLNDIEQYTSKKKTESIDNVISMKDIENYAKKNDKNFLSKVGKLESDAQAINEAKQNYSKEQMEISKKWENKRNTYFFSAVFCISFAIFVFPLLLVIPLLICGILCNMLAKKTRVLTQKGVNESEKWKALKRYMENFSLLDEREVPELVLWEKYLVYATAFGVADKVLSQLKVRYPELADDDYMANSPYSYIYMMNRYNFNKTLTSSMQKAYSAGLREKAAREAASSSYSSGGGRRRWLLWRRRTAEVAGGRNGRKIIFDLLCIRNDSMRNTKEGDKKWI